MGEKHAIDGIVRDVIEMEMDKGYRKHDRSEMD